MVLVTSWVWCPRALELRVLSESTPPAQDTKKVLKLSGQIVGELKVNYRKNGFLHHHSLSSTRPRSALSSL